MVYLEDNINGICEKCIDKFNSENVITSTYSCKNCNLLVVPIMPYIRRDYYMRHDIYCISICEIDVYIYQIDKLIIINGKYWQSHLFSGYLKEAFEMNSLSECMNAI